MNRRFAPLLALLALASLPMAAQFSTRPDNNGSPGPNYVDEGTRFMIQLTQNLDSNKLKPGKRFKARLAEDLVAPNGTLIPAGKAVRGHISDVTRGMHSKLLLSFDEIETAHGWRPLVASVSDVPGEHGVKPVSDEGEIERRGTDKQRTIKDGVEGAAAGGVIGAIAGGGHGAAIGAGAGAGVGVAKSLFLDGNLKLLKGQQIELRLDRPLQVPQA